MYERATVSNASTSNIEGWYEELEISAAELLETLDGREDLSETEVLARDAAALVYVYLAVEHANEDIDLEPLEMAGVDTDVMLKKFRQGVVEACVAEGQDRAKVAVAVGAKFASLYDFSWNLLPAYWGQIVEPSTEAFIATLIESGVVLPELNEDGMYGEDDELDL